MRENPTKPCAPCGESGYGTAGRAVGVPQAKQGVGLGPAAGSRRFGGSGNRSSGGGAVACRITVCFCPKNGKDRHKKETLLIWIIGGALAALP